MLMQRKLLLSFIACISIGLAGCFESKEKVQANSAASEPEVLAVVNDEAIAVADVDFMINKTFAEPKLVLNDTITRGKILQSLIASKSMKQLAEAKLTEEKRKYIEAAAKFYKEELLVKEYLLANAVPKPVTTKMISDYYNNNLAEFGQATKKVVEILRSKNQPSEQQRDKLLARVATLKQTEDWQAVAQDEINGLGLEYLKTTLRQGLLAPQIESAAKNLKLGESSNIIFINGVPTMLRMAKLQQQPAKPLAEVSAKIRQKLASLQLKRAVKIASDQSIINANITRK